MKLFLQALLVFLDYLERWSEKRRQKKHEKEVERIRQDTINAWNNEFGHILPVATDTDPKPSKLPADQASPSKSDTDRGVADS